MQQSPQEAEQSIRPSEHHINEASSGRPHPPPHADTPHSNSFTDNIHSPLNPAGLQDFHHSLYQQYEHASGSNVPHTPHLGHDLGTQTYLSPQPSNATFRSSDYYDNSTTGGVDEWTGLLLIGSPCNKPGRWETGLLQTSPSQAISAHRKSLSLTNAVLAQSQSMPDALSRYSSAPLQQADGQTKFGPFRGLFSTSLDAKQHRRVKMRFDRQPYYQNDHTIAQVEADRTKNVERIYNAMTRGDVARDNHRSVAVKRWIREPHYSSDLIEAYAHKVFDCLLEQAKEGFRGWHHNDYVVDDRKGDDEDRDIDCAGRLENIILALEQEKTICEDVMNSACQIRMFVNAPRAYANRKHQNRVGNSKRPNATAKEELIAARGRKARGRRNRGRASTMSDVPLSRDTPSRQLPDNISSPTFPTPASQRLASGPLTKSHFARQVPYAQELLSPPSSFAEQHQMNMMSPSAMSRSAPARTPQWPDLRLMTAMSSEQKVPPTSPALLHEYHSSSASPGDVKPTISAMNINALQHAATANNPMSSSLQQSSLPNEPSFSHVQDWSQSVPIFKPFETTGSANLFDHFPNLDVSMVNIDMLPPTLGDANANLGNYFDPMWDQGLLFDDFTPHDQGQS